MATLHSYALTTVADVKESLGITNDTKNNLIIRKINQATDMIENFCGLDNDHHFKETTYTNEVYDASLTDQLVFKARPVTAVSSVQSRDTTTNEDDWTTIDATDYFFDEFRGVLSGLSSFAGGYSRYRVSYTAGFSTIPSDLAEACVMLASALVTASDQSGAGSGVKRKQEGQREVEYFQPNESNSGSLIEQLGIDNMLARYINYVV